MYQIQNNESELVYLETADFMQFENVELLPPEEGKSYKVKVESGETKHIIIKLGCNGFSLSKSFSYILYKKQEALIKDCLANGQMQERADNITQHMLQHQGGVLIIYKNQSITNHVLKEKITFTLDGLTIRGNDPDDKVVSFELLPDQEKVVQLDTVRGGFTFNM